MTAVAFQCWGCGKARGATDALCPECGKVQPPRPAPRPGEDAAPLDKFAVLGLPVGFELEVPLLEERYRALSRKLHPDRFARASSRERRFSLEQTTILNDAYRTLKDPVRRAEHVLRLHGVDASGEPGPRVPGQPAPQAGQVPMEFLEEALEDRERLLEAKTEGGPAEVEKLAAEVRKKRDATLAALASRLGELGAAHPGGNGAAGGNGGSSTSASQDSATAAAERRKAALDEAAGLLYRLRYYGRYLDEVEGRSEGHG